MKISDCLCPRSYQNEPNLPASSTYQEVKSAVEQENAITLRTNDGDKVSISQSYGKFFELNSTNTSSEGNNLQTFTAESMQYQSFDFTVEGDLNKEEITDIKHLFKDLFKIAGNFFNGDMQKAFKGIDKLDSHMGTISEVSASFSRSSTISTYSNNYHPMTDFQDKLADSFQNLEKFQNDDDLPKKMLKAQWRQIAGMLDLHEHLLDEDNSDTPIVVDSSSPNRLTEPHTKKAANIPAEDILAEEYGNSNYLPEEFFSPKKHSIKQAEKMMQRIVDTLDKNPRLSPFTVPLANRAIDEAARMDAKEQERFQITNGFKSDFMKQFDKWFFS
jgi:hypothetical protein